MYTFHLTVGVLSALSSLVLSALPEPLCWTPALSPDALVFKECYDIITKQIPRTGSFNADTPLIFSRDKALRPDIETPHSWISRPPRNCIIGVDIPAAVGGTEKTSLKDIEYAAKAIAVRCIIQPPHLGGILTIGWQGKLNVVITGMNAPRRTLRLQKAANGTEEERPEVETA
ncbi:MAG: hypothetical protein Q9208_003408 [Pyrenodesmia sp. 3 TL-2023]